MTQKLSIVVLENSNEKVNKFGILVDGVSTTVEIKDKQIEQIPEVGTKYNTEIIYGMYAKGDDLLMLLNVEKMLLSEVNKSDL
nr:chemotaxis protein CheW [uncultured Carboxylicivirga sp.]